MFRKSMMVYILSLTVLVCRAQRQQVDGGQNSRTQLQPRFPARYVPTSGQQRHFSQQQQQKYYGYNYRFAPSGQFIPPQSTTSKGHYNPYSGHGQDIQVPNSAQGTSAGGTRKEQQSGWGNQQYVFDNQVYAAVSTPPPLTLPPHPPTMATLFPSLVPTPPPQPVYDPVAHMSAVQEPYHYNFDFAPGTPIVYCSYGANPIPVYNTAKKKCIPYHPMCGISFTCIFDVDPRTGHVWGHAQGTKK